MQMLAQDMCKSNRSWAWIFQINLKGKKNGPGLLYGPCLFRKGSRIPVYGPCLVSKGSRTVTDLVWIWVWVRVPVVPQPVEVVHDGDRRGDGEGVQRSDIDPFLVVAVTLIPEVEGIWDWIPGLEGTWLWVPDVEGIRDWVSAAVSIFGLELWPSVAAASSFRFRPLFRIVCSAPESSTELESGICTSGSTTISSARSTWLR